MPQGSILGPLLFLIYMNDIYNATSSFQFIQFADDTSVFMSDNNLYNICTRFNYELEKLSQWLSVNKLVLNTKKTNYMVFTNRYINTNIDIKIGDENIKCAPSLKFLGITIDNKLTWHEHIGVVCTRVSKGVGILNRLRFLPQSILRTIYSAIILPYLNYCNTAWSNSTDYYMNRLFLLQKKAIRIITHSFFLCSL